MGMKVNGTSGLTFPDTTTLASAGQSSVQAWVNFNGTGTVAIRASFNVSSITDNGTGDYTVNFTNAMVDDNFALIGMAGADAVGDEFTISFLKADTSTSSKRIFCSTNYQPGTSNGVAGDEIVHVAVFR